MLLLIALRVVLTPRLSVGWSVSQSASWWLSVLPTCVSTTSGLSLSDQLSTADSTRSSDDDPGPGRPRGRSTVHIHSGSAI
ncbi:hypothetical protein PBY51_023213 [Eleginops maclovinus]|uniref:Secreted protein n=1 Tax=Eleginops maclovinus TaxID=56733 RepID=A0AAN7WZI7_ELEMC|nr:hypothetical protein PBY51_023213 [Eleginops maclovinus]